MKILIATCGSRQSDKAVQTGAEMARITRGSLTILTVIKDPQRRAEAQAIVEKAVALAQETIGDTDNGQYEFEIDTRVRLGHPAEEIVNEAGQGSYSVIVVGTWPKQNLLHSLLAPTTERIIMQAPCPVMVAKGKMGPLRHVLLCVSGAESPSKAACVLADMARQITGQLNVTVLHVMSQISASPDVREGWQLGASAEELIQEQTPEGQWLRQEIDRLKASRAQIQPKVRHGLVVDEVLMEALEGNSDLLVIGAHRQAGWQRFLLDDLTHQIVAGADRPVLVV